MSSPYPSVSGAGLPLHITVWLLSLDVNSLSPAPLVRASGPDFISTPPKNWD